MTITSCPKMCFPANYVKRARIATGGLPPPPVAPALSSHLSLLIKLTKLKALGVVQVVYEIFMRKKVSVNVICPLATNKVKKKHIPLLVLHIARFEWRNIRAGEIHEMVIARMSLPTVSARHPVAAAWAALASAG